MFRRRPCGPCLARQARVALLALPPAGCVAVDPDPALFKFLDCAQMQAYMARQAEQEVLWEHRWEPGGFLSAIFGAEYEVHSYAGYAYPPSSYSSTNLQEAGVDEADLVKTDGSRLYSLADGNLVVSQAWPYQEAAELARVALDGTPDGIYLYGDTVVALSDVLGAPAPRSGQGVRARDGQPLTLVTLVDVSDPAQPEVVRETYAQGSLEATRRIDDRLFVVTHHDLKLAAGAEDVREARRLVEAAEPSDWLAWRWDHSLGVEGWSVSKDTICDCSEVWASEREGGTWLVSVMSLDLGDPLSSFAGEAVVGEVETVYASAQAIYVAATEYSYGPFPTMDDSLDTIVHAFDISAADSHPVYAASAKVTGTLSDSFALSEHEGVLRLATTEYVDTPSVQVHSLQERGGAFEHLDALRGLVEGEEIYAVRFAGDLGYVVTYEAWMGDPLLSFDLSDPGDIRLGGALEVSGFSNYLHPMDEDHLLSVGMDESRSGSWQLAVSLFDVSDLSEPLLSDRELLDAWGSEAQSDHHAFNYFAAQDALAIPSWALEGDPVLEVLVATPEGLEPSGQLRQDQVLEAFSTDASSCAFIRRSVIMDDLVYGVGSAGFTVAALDAPQDVLAAVPFGGLDPCNDYEEIVWW